MYFEWKNVHVKKDDNLNYFFFLENVLFCLLIILNEKSLTVVLVKM